MTVTMMTKRGQSTIKVQCHLKRSVRFCTLEADGSETHCNLKSGCLNTKNTKLVLACVVEFRLNWFTLMKVRVCWK